MRPLDTLELDPELAQELESLTPEQRTEVLEELALRARARRIADELSLDCADVLGQLKQLRRAPVERLELGLRHGRRRAQLPQ